MGIEPNRDVTINWEQKTLESEGVFFTDSNGLHIVKRTKRTGKNDDTLISLAPANFYPINSAIFIENSPLSHQMIVMNDRTQSGSAFRKGRIELMYDRRIYATDSLGNPENLDETNESGAPLRSHHKYWLKFTKTREEAFRVISRRSLLTQNPPMIF